jgi:hypothetical protein
MNGLRQTARLKNLTTSISSTSQPDNYKNQKIDGTDYLSAERRPCPYWSIFKTDQEGRRRQVLVVQWRGSTIAIIPF